MDYLLLIYELIRAILFPAGISWFVIPMCILMLGIDVYAMHSLFVLAGRKGGKAFVPFANIVELYQLAWEGRYGICCCLAETAYALLSLIDIGLFEHPFLKMAASLCIILSFVLQFFMKAKLSRSFDNDEAMSFGLIFMEPVFLYLLARNRPPYLGPCRTTKKKKVFSFHEQQNTPKRNYMISLYRRRSRIALYTGIIIVFFSLRAVANGLLHQYIIVADDPSYHFFHYFTVNSGMLSSIGAAFMIPYAFEGIRKKRFVLPKWVTLFQLSGAICTSITMVFSILFIAPTQGIANAFSGNNFWLHIVCPISALILLFTVEVDRTISVKDVLECMAPFFLYSLVYLFFAIILGEENGGWRDFYMLGKFMPPSITFPVFYMFSFSIAFAIRHIYNRLSSIRKKQLTASWSENVSPIEINIEVYGLGRFNGETIDPSDIVIPIDIFCALADKYGMNLSKLCAIYNRGVIDGLKEQKERNNPFLQKLSDLIGKPEKDQDQTKQSAPE